MSVLRLLIRTPLVLFVALGVVGGAHAQSGGSVEIGPDGVRLMSAEEAFEVRLRNDMYLDARALSGTDASPGADRFFLRRVRPRLQGQMYERFAFSVRPDFGIGGPEIDDAFAEARFAPALRLRVGRFKVPVGLEVLASTAGLMHVERGFPAGLVPGRDVGVMMEGTVWQDRAEYAVGLFNGTPGATGPGADVDDAKEGAARLLVTPLSGREGPLSGLGLGVAGTIGGVTGTDAAPALTRLSTTGRQTFFSYRSDARADGTRWRVVPQAHVYAGPVELLGEYAVTAETVRLGISEETLTHRAWQASAAVVLTGEEAREGMVTPDDPFGTTPGMGAFELGARVHGATVDDDAFSVFADPAAAASEATAWGLTLSWYPNATVRFMMGYERTAFEAAGIATPRDPEHLLLTRMQVAF
ncbi:MAG: OprO/OprP family phosphate-selective porin [Salinivenus sp.]